MWVDAASADTLSARRSFTRTRSNPSLQPTCYSLWSSDAGELKRYVRVNLRP